MTDFDEDLPLGEVFTERTPVDPYRELCALLQRPRSGFGPFDQLLQKAEVLVGPDGQFFPDLEWGDLKQAFDLEVADIKDFLVWSSRFQEQTPELVELIAQAFSILENLEWQSARLDESADEGDTVNLVFSLEQLGYSLQEFSSSLQALRQLEERQPKFSEVPYVQELFRLAEAVRRGALGPDLLEERLLVYEEVQRFVHDSLHHHGELSDSDLNKIDEAFALQNEGLDFLFAYLECHKVSALDKGLALVQQAWAQLLEMRQEMLLAQERAELPTCLRCGLLNPQGVRRCSACQARLPEQSSFQVSTTDVPDTRPCRSGLEHITRVVSRMSAGQLSLQQFADEVDVQRGLYRQASALLVRLEASAQSLPTQEKADFNQARQLFTQGLKELDSGIHQLEQFIEVQRLSRTRLEIPGLALEKIRVGHETLGQLTELVDHL